MVKATNGKAISSDNNIEVEASNFEYVKSKNILKAFNGLAFIKADNIQIEFEEITIDQKNFWYQQKIKQLLLI